MIGVYTGWPGRIVSGAGALGQLGAEVERFGAKRVIFFSGPHIGRTPMVQNPMAELMELGVQCELFCRLGANPTDEMVADAVAVMQAFAPELIVCIGGGSPIDCAKAANVLYTHGGKLSDYNVNLGGMERIEDKLLPFIAVPTTAGTGSEVTDVGVITDTQRHVKFGVKSPYLVPDVALLDPMTTVALSPKTTAETGLDALTHCIESYVSVVGCCIAEAEALEAIRMICRWLPVAYENGADIQAREKMLLASMMAGCSFNINNLGLCHQMAHQLSAYFGLAHGLANAVLLPQVMRFNLPAAPEKYARIAQAMGCNTAGMEAEEAALAGIEAVEALCRRMGVTPWLDDLGVDKAAVPAMAVTALQDGVGATNPIPTTVEQCEGVFYKCFRA